MLTATLPDLNTLTLDALKALIVAQHERLLTREREVEHLQLLIARLQRMQFGRKSEKLAQQIEQAGVATRRAAVGAVRRLRSRGGAFRLY
jgi:transposase